jgi:hypothetical protein
LLLFSDPVFTSYIKDDHKCHNEYQQNYAPDDDVSGETTLCAPGQKHDHQSQAATDNADNKDQIFDNLSAS